MNYHMRQKKSVGQLALKKQLGNDLIGAQGKDFSGMDFRDLSIQGQNFFESMFNGCFFSGVQASQSIFQHAEFTETHFSGCVFEGTSFDHSDFVLANFKNCQFVSCSFQNGEWRDTVFDGVQFLQCIFRNTTTSLAHFIRCSLDDSSAASFVGSSKRFSLFSGTEFRLPHEHVDFLQTNFGLLSATELPGAFTAESDNPFFELALRRYAGTLTSKQFYHLLLRALCELIATQGAPNRLRLRYLSEICKLCMDEQFLSVFAIQLLENAFSQKASLIDDRDQVLELLSLVLALRVGLRERVAGVDEQLSDIPRLPSSEVRLKLEFDHTYTRTTIEDYMDQMASYCRLPKKQILIEGIRPGSTIVDILITGSAYVGDLFRFLKYSLSLATVTVNQADKLKKAYSGLTKVSKKKADVAKTLPGGRPVRGTLRGTLSENVRDELRKESGGCQTHRGVCRHGWRASTCCEWQSAGNDSPCMTQILLRYWCQRLRATRRDVFDRLIRKIDSVCHHKVHPDMIRVSFELKIPLVHRHLVRQLNFRNCKNEISALWHDSRTKKLLFNESAIDVPKVGGQREIAFVT